MHTPEQARGLWCPHVRGARLELMGPAHMGSLQPTTVVAGCNTDALGGNRVPASCRCIADKCAMWRWVSPPRHDPYPTPEADAANAGSGFCGLAGRPEVAP